LLGLILAFFLFEGLNYSKNNIALINNHVEALDDSGNEMESNRWINEINPADYQAIMPLPYFHIGSESTWIEAKCDMAKQVYIASLKTGLPTNAVMLSRTSLSQTYKNLELIKAPWKEYRVLNDYPDNRPLLLLVANCDELNLHEQNLVDHAVFLNSSEFYKVYELSIDSLRGIPAQVNYSGRYQAFQAQLNQAVVHDSSSVVILSLNKEKEYSLASKWDQLSETKVVLDPSKKLYLRCWVKNYDSDMIVRTQVRIFQSSLTHATLEEKYTDLWRHIVTLCDDWALIEIPLDVKQRDEIIKFQIRNSEISGTKIIFGDFNISQVEI
jgi:hypothetical protein